MSDETKHSPEPWTLTTTRVARHPDEAEADDTPATCWAIDAAGWGELATVYGRDDDPEGDAEGAANARRIVACVNACKDLPTEALEAGKLGEALDALLGYHCANRIHNDSEAEMYERSGPPLFALGKIRVWP